MPLCNRPSRGSSALTLSLLYFIWSALENRANDHFQQTRTRLRVNWSCKNKLQNCLSIRVKIWCIFGSPTVLDRVGSGLGGVRILAFPSVPAAWRASWNRTSFLGFGLTRRWSLGAAWMQSLCVTLTRTWRSACCARGREGLCGGGDPSMSLRPWPWVAAGPAPRPHAGGGGRVVTLSWTVNSYLERLPPKIAHIRWVCACWAD